jgi:hypothetical protein
VRILTKEECLLVAGGYSSSSTEPLGAYMVENYYDPNAPVSTPEPAPGLDQDPFFQSIGAHFATNEDADALAELFSSANYSVGEVQTTITGAYTGSGVWNGVGDDFMFALNMANAFQDMASFHSPDENVMAALDNAGINYTVGADGSIFAPGFGFAVADGTSFTPASAIDSSSTQPDPQGATNAVLVIGHTDQQTLTDVPTFGGDTIVITGNVQQASAPLAWLAEKGVELLIGVLGNEVDRWIHQDPSDPARQAQRERLNQMEPHVNALFNPSQPINPMSLHMRDGSVLTGFTQNHIFFADIRGPNGGPNGIPDIAFTQNPTTGQFYTNYGAGWIPTANPFVNRPGF